MVAEQESWFKRHWIFTAFLIVLLLWWINRNSEEQTVNLDNQDNFSARYIFEKSPFQITNQITDSYSEVKELHFSHMPISYKINDFGGCNGVVIKRTRDAFEIIQNKTNGLINFTEISEGSPDINITCFDRDIIISKNSKCEYFAQECYNYSFPYSKSVLDKYKETSLDESSIYISQVKRLKATQELTTYQVCYINKTKFNISEAYIINGSSIRNSSNYQICYVNDTVLVEILKTSDKPFVIGEGGINEIKGNIIKNGIIHLFKQLEYDLDYNDIYSWASCAEFPVREMHEILHVFGFSHPETQRSAKINITFPFRPAESSSDIMAPEVDCSKQTKLDYKYISCLEKIYSDNKFGSCEGVSLVNLVRACPLGWYPVGETDYCCPKPNMTISDNYCK
jgi:hypothetical protein